MGAAFVRNMLASHNHISLYYSRGRSDTRALINSLTRVYAYYTEFYGGRELHSAASFEELPVSDIKPPVSVVNSPVSCIKPPVLVVKPPVSGIKLPVSSLKLPASGIKPPVSVVNSPISGLFPASFGNKAPCCRYEAASCGIKSR